MLLFVRFVCFLLFYSLPCPRGACLAAYPSNFRLGVYCFFRPLVFPSPASFLCFIFFYISLLASFFFFRLFLSLSMCWRESVGFGVSSATVRHSII